MPDIFVRRGRRGVARSGGWGLRQGVGLGALMALHSCLATTVNAAEGEPAAVAGNARAPAFDVPGPERAASAAATAPVLLALRGDRLDEVRLAALLVTELGRPVALESEPPPAQVAGVVTVAHRRSAGELAVTWERDGQTLTRVVAAPSDAALLENDAALLAGNLAREQVEELLPARLPPRQNAETAPPEPERWAATVGIFYPLATHHGHADVTSSFDLNLFYGRVGAIDGAQIGGVNVVGREGSAPASMRGVQLGVLANLVDGEARGVQLGGLFNQVSGGARGAQLSMGANHTDGAVRGLQAAFAFNHAGSLSGLQLSAVNVAGDVNGIQLGLVNVARRVRGASIGLVNVADDIEGLPLAPFSVTRTGGVHPLAWSGSSGLGNVGVKLATRHTYTAFFGSYHRAYDLTLLGGGVALGGSVELGPSFRSDIDLSGTYLVAPALRHDPSRSAGYHEQLVQPRLRLMIAYRAARHFGLFGGIAALGQVRAELGWDRVTVSVGPEIFGGVEL